VNHIIDAVEALFDEAAEAKDTATLDRLRDDLADLGMAAMQLSLALTQRQTGSASAHRTEKTYRDAMRAVRGRHPRPPRATLDLSCGAILDILRGPGSDEDDQ